MNVSKRSKPKSILIRSQRLKGNLQTGPLHCLLPAATIASWLQLNKSNSSISERPVHADDRYLWRRLQM